jgi:hypothetical protein
MRPRVILACAALAVAGRAGAELPESRGPALKAVPASSACREDAPSGPTSVVKALYLAYPWQGTKVPHIEPLDVLLEFFDERLAGLFVKDLECQRRTNGLCKISSSVIYAAQDADIKDFKLCAPAPGGDRVEARFVNFGRPTTVFFEVKATSRGWRIADLGYNEGDSFVKYLSAP